MEALSYPMSIEKDKSICVTFVAHSMATKDILEYSGKRAFGGSGKDKVFENLTVISASKEGNKIVLMDKDKSYYEVPRDTLLEGYNKQQEKQHKAEQKHRNANRIDVGWER